MRSPCKKPIKIKKIQKQKNPSTLPGRISQLGVDTPDYVVVSIPFLGHVGFLNDKLFRLFKNSTPDYKLK